MGLKVEVLGFCRIGRKIGTMSSPGRTRKCLQWLLSSQNTQIAESQTPPVTCWGLIPIVSLVSLFCSALHNGVHSASVASYKSSIDSSSAGHLFQEAQPRHYWAFNVQRRMWNLWTFSHTQRIPRILRCISFYTFLWTELWIQFLVVLGTRRTTMCGRAGCTVSKGSRSHVRSIRELYICWWNLRILL